MKDHILDIVRHKRSLFDPIDRIKFVVMQDDIHKTMSVMRGIRWPVYIDHSVFYKWNQNMISEMNLYADMIQYKELV